MKILLNQFRYWLVLLFITTVSNQVFAQNNCDATAIKTYPDGAGSLNPNDIRSQNTQVTNKRNKGMFDWRMAAIPIYSSGILTQYPQIFSPFDYYDAADPSLYTNKDRKPEDGWELIREDRGYLLIKDGDNTKQTQRVGHPFFILYNRYTAKLRVFVAFGEQHTDYSAGAIQLVFVQNSNSSGCSRNTESLITKS